MALKIENTKIIKRLMQDDYTDCKDPEAVNKMIYNFKDGDIYLYQMKKE